MSERTPMAALLVTPISPRVAGNGLAQRAAMWADVLGSSGAPTLVVVPVAGPAHPEHGEHVLLPGRRERDDVPALARGVDRRAGRAAGVLLAAGSGIGPVDVIVCLRSYLGRAALGLRDVLGGALVLDLDDDDVAFFAASGHPDEAERFARLLGALRPQADLVVSAGGVAGTAVVPNSVPLPEARARRPGAAQVLMVGNMGYEPNREGAAWFLDTVLPRIEADAPGVSVCIAGPGSETFAPHGVGYVDDLTARYDTASVVVAPVLVGSGTRTKIIEAWAHGAPVASTSIGAAGLGGVDGEHLLLADDAPAFAAAVLALLTDPARAARLGHAGRILAASHFDRARVVAATRARLAELRSDLAVAPAPELHVVETDEGLVVLDIPSGDVHELDVSTSVVFSLLDGHTGPEAVAAAVADAFTLPAPPVALVQDAMQTLLAAGLLVRTRRTPLG